MAKQVWWYRFMFQILVAIFWRVFLRHRTFISIIWSWAGQSSTQDGSKRWKKLVSFPMVFTCCVSCNPKITLCQYYWCKDECISCHLGCFLFEVPLIELVRNANFAKHLDLDAQKRFEMKMMEMMDDVLGFVFSDKQFECWMTIFCPKWRAN